jgi:hypothetical protein
LYTKNLAWLAKLLNVAVKLTGGPSYAGDAYPFKSLPPHYCAIYGTFRATDITKMPCSWNECVTQFQEIDWIPAPARG